MFNVQSLVFLEPIRSSLRSLCFRGCDSLPWTIDSVQLLRSFQLISLRLLRYRYSSSVCDDVIAALTRAFSVNTVNAFICAMALQPHLEELTLNFRWMCDEISFTPLQSSASLHTLTLTSNVAVGVHHLQQLRPLPLTQLILHPCDREAWLLLLQMEGPPLRWTNLPYDCSMIDDAVASLLPAALPHVTEVAMGSLNETSPLSSFAFLSQMPALHSLTLVWDEYESESALLYDNLLAKMNRPLLQLLKFHLDSSKLNSAELKALLSLMPQLQRLGLCGMQNLDSLSCLMPVKSTLQSLYMNKCQHPQLIATELVQLGHLKQLTELSLYSSFTDSAESMVRALFTPPSALLPNLTHFIYSPPVDSESEEDESEDDDEEDEARG